MLCPLDGQHLGDHDATMRDPPASHAATLPAAGATVPGGHATSATAQSGLAAGRVLDQKYAVGNVIGSGAMGMVCEGHHVLLGRKVAIKTLGRIEPDQVASQGRMLAEGRLLASIAHPHVVQIYDLGILDGAAYLVMERLHGETLADRIARVGALPIDEAVVIMRQMLAGLGAVHRHGIVHRDLKPANVFLVAAGDGAPHVKLLDFGVSTPIVAAGDGEGRIIGTPAFLAPEQARGEAVDARADLWALGVCAYAMLTGTLPFSSPYLNELMIDIATAEPPPPSARRRDIGPDLDAIVMRALAKRREDRFADAGAMLAALAGRDAEPAEIRAGAPSELALVAEPDPHLAARWGGAVRGLGLVPIFTSDGEEAREMIAAVGMPRLLVTNLALPGEDGFALLRAIRAEGRASCVAIALSPASELRATARARRAELGLAAVLDSNIDQAVLGDVIRRALLEPGPVASVPKDLPQRPELAETRRLDRIAAMKLVDDAPPDAALQRLVEDVARELRVPVALVSLVLRDRQWFKAHFGLAGALLADRGSPREWAFCRHVVESGAPLVVPDARQNPVFAANPLVEDGTVGSYAGAPLVTPTGEVLGTLCIIDHDRNRIGRDKVDDLVILARRVAGELSLLAEGGAGPAGPKRTSTEQHRLMAVLANLDSAVLLLGADRRVVFANEALAALAGSPVASILGQSRDAFIAQLGSIFEDPAEYARRMRVPPEGPFAGREDFVAARPSRRVIRWSAKPVDMKDGVGQLETYTELPLS
ncbi:Serine/threonine protein kinase [Minicystis rosea]|nr:Serine/threonine protein kinase [Minicystis rosea]